MFSPEVERLIRNRARGEEERRRWSLFQTLTKLRRDQVTELLQTMEQVVHNWNTWKTTCTWKTTVYPLPTPQIMYVRCQMGIIFIIVYLDREQMCQDYIAYSLISYITSSIICDTAQLFNMWGRYAKKKATMFISIWHQTKNCPISIQIRLLNDSNIRKDRAKCIL